MTVQFAYDAASRRTSLTLPNGVVTELGYNAASQLIGLKYRKGAMTLGDLTYEYDALGRRGKIGGSFARTNLPAVVSSATYNGVNSQTTFAGVSLTYDLNGNLTSDGTHTYVWNARDQLVSINGPGLNASFLYDAEGRRITKTINSTTTSLLYDGDDVVQEKLGTAVSANMLIGGIDEVFARSEVSGGWSLITDALGSTIALTDTAGTVQTQYTFEAFGKTTASGASNGNPSQYSGREHDETGLYYYRARYYSPSLHRFIAEDPQQFEAGDVNLYAYVGNDPVNFNDPFGLERSSPMEDALEWAEWAADILDVRPSMGFANPDGSVTRNGILGGAVRGAFRALARSGGRAAKTAPKLKLPKYKFPGDIKDHICRHAPGMTKREYFDEAMRNILTGKRFLVRHDGQWKYHYVTRVGPDEFLFTSTPTNCKVILTHMRETAQYLENKGIKLPKDF
jgi:RHS repeat-associated protein